jgi:glucokinase
VIELVALDLGGTHARFALATIAPDGTISLAEPVTLQTSDYDTPELAWAEFARRLGRPAPRAAAIGIAGPVIDGLAPMTNSPWVLDVGAFRESLGLEAVTALNDFGAVAHAAARLGEDQLAHLTGPDRPLPDQGTISVIGPGTGMGVAHFHRYPGGYRVQSTEGGHIGFAPQDDFDDRVLALLRARHGRVVTERVNAGPGIAVIYEVLGGTEWADDLTVWKRGLAREDELASRAVDRFCASLGAVAGDYALAHGAGALVLAGGIGLRLRERLPQSEFAARFCAKPRYERMMAGIPVKLIVHPQPGLYGAVAAFEKEHSR